MRAEFVASWKASRFKAEIALLLALCVFLPLLEAPKNLAWLAWLAAWTANRIRARDFGGPWDAWDTLIAAWLASGFVVAAAVSFGEIRDAEWRGAIDLARYASVAWLVKRARYGEREQRWILGALVASTLAGLAVGYARMWSGVGKSGTLQLHSVGHVNHSAIYLAIMLGVATAWLFARFRAWDMRTRFAGFLVFAVFLTSLVVMASRAAVGAGLALLAVLAIAWWPRWRVPLAIAGAAGVLVIAGAIAVGAELVVKQQRYESQDAAFSYRDGIWRMGIAGWERHPWFGVGMSNYPHITPERVKTWRTQAGRDYDPARFTHFPHAHSLYVNTLAERGIVGSAALLAVLLAWLHGLLRARPRAAEDDLAWTVWGASASGWFVTVVAGLLNTTLHNEHGILAALLLGLWLGRPRPRAGS
jgi:O-antigen ligase